MGKDVSGKNPKKRYHGKLAYLIRQGIPLDQAKRQAAGYAGGKQAPDKSNPDSMDQLENDKTGKEMGSQDQGDMGAMTKPCTNPEDMPADAQALPADAMAVWMDAFNSAAEDGEDEEGCGKIAWAAVNNAGYAKDSTGAWTCNDRGRKARGLVDLLGVQFDEYYNDPANPGVLEYVSEIQIMTCGTWDHPLYGKFTITPDDLDLFVNNFYANVRGIDLAIDQEHVPEGGAAGWFKEVFKRLNTLWAKVAWTPTGYQLVRDKVYRYFSPEFDFVYKDPGTGKTFQNVLYGGGLTNRPFLKGMEPIMLSEAVAQEVLANFQSNFIPWKGGEPSTGKAGTGSHNNPAINREGEKELFKLTELITMFGWPADTTEDQAKVLLAEMKPAAGAVKPTAGAGETVQLAEQVGRLTQRLELAEQKNTTLEKANLDERWARITTKAFAEGRLTKQLADTFKPQFDKDPTGTETILNAMPKLVPGETGHAGGDQGGAGAGSLQLSEAVRNTIAQLGVTEEVFLKHNPEFAPKKGE